MAQVARVCDAIRGRARGHDRRALVGCSCADRRVLAGSTLLDILIVAFLIYQLLQFIRGTHAVQMALGALVLVLLYWVSQLAATWRR